MSRKGVIKDNKKKLLDDAKKSMTYKKILASFSDAQLIDVESEDKNWQIFQKFWIKQKSSRQKWKKAKKK